MRPLRLTIEGFTAFRDRQEIDFEPLELFVITGATGAGKTSILDAMSFALYGRVPRIGGTQGTSDVISLGTDRAAVDFEFRVGQTGRYRVARRISRRASQSVTLQRHEGVDWVPDPTGGVTDTNHRIEEIIGLDFDGFTRAVILPQGEFHRFLKGEAKDRRKVLFSLLGVSYFQRMGGLARSKQADLVAAVKRTEDLLAEHYAEATTAHLEELQGFAARADAAKLKISAALRTAAEQANLASQHTARIIALETAAGDLKTLAATVAASIDSIRAAETTHAAAVATLNSRTGELEAARATTSALEAAFNELTADVGTLADLAAATAAAQTLSEATDGERAAVSELETAIEAQSAATAELDRVAALDADLVIKVTDAKTAEEAALAAMTVAGAGAADLERARSTADKQTAELSSADEALADIEARLPALQEAAAATRGDLRVATARWEEHRRVHAVAELAIDLGEGDPCPVCGVALANAVAVDPDAAEALESAQAAEQAARDLAEKRDRVIATTQAEITSARARRDESRQRLMEALAGHADLAKLMDAAAGAKEALAGRTVEAGRLSEARVALESARETARQAVVDAQLSVTQANGVVDAAESTILDVRRRRDTAQELLGQRFGDTVPDNALERLDANRRKVIAESAAVDDARSNREDLNRQHADAADAVAKAQRTLTGIDVELARASTMAATLGGQLAASPGSVDVGQPAAVEASREQSAQRLATWCTSAVGAVTDARKAAGGERDAAAAAVLAQARGQKIDAPDAETALGLLRQGEQDAISRASAAHAAVGECERNLAAREKMESEVKDDRERISVLASLGLELKNDRFGDYIIDETLGLLSDRASTELNQISGGRYSLRPAKGEFQVVDHANADERRSVKTLSGGETFLASLALALALSRHVGELAAEGMGAKLESVFIDEGFGTLDPATLEEVIDALERLRAEDLVVGVISHVPELAQRIQTGLEVQQHDGRSRIVAALTD